MLPNEIDTGHGCTFAVQERNVKHWTGVNYDAIYLGKVTWADNDHWDWPEWMHTFISELRASHSDKKITTISGDKGLVEIYFRHVQHVV